MADDAGTLVVFTEEDREAFKSLRSRTSDLLKSALEPCSAVMQQAIQDWGRRVRTYASNPVNATLTGTDKREFTEVLEQSMVRQAISSTIPDLGCALFTTLPSDMVQNSELYLSKQRSAEVVSA